jgi:DNA-binding transcriptional LysR family regulator
MKPLGRSIPGEVFKASQVKTKSSRHNHASSPNGLPPAATAGRVVHVSQPALTRSIISLEGELGLPLFERSKSGMLPTEFAVQVAPRFEELLLELDDIQRGARLYRNLESRRLRIGLGQAIREAVSRHCLPRFVER